MSEHRCFMGYLPGEDEGETFYIMVMQELTIYGHTVDAAIKRDYPEDWQHTLDTRANGYEFACWHSNACRDGEIGSNLASGLREITREQFIQAWDAGWPDLEDHPITQEGPVAAVGYFDEHGNPVKVWDSLHGDYD
jgi:hypothetical protein